MPRVRCSTWNRYSHKTPFHVKRRLFLERCRKDPR